MAECSSPRTITIIMICVQLGCAVLGLWKLVIDLCFTDMSPNQYAAYIGAFPIIVIMGLIPCAFALYGVLARKPELLIPYIYFTLIIIAIIYIAVAYCMFDLYQSSEDNDEILVAKILLFLSIAVFTYNGFCPGLRKVIEYGEQLSLEVPSYNTMQFLPRCHMMIDEDA